MKLKNLEISGTHGNGRVWQMSAHWWGWATNDGSQGSEQSMEAAIKECEDYLEVEELYATTNKI